MALPRMMTMMCHFETRHQTPRRQQLTQETTETEMETDRLFNTSIDKFVKWMVEQIENNKLDTWLANMSQR